MHNSAFAHKVSMFSNLIAYYQEQNQWAAGFTPVSQGTFLFMLYCTDPKFGVLLKKINIGILIHDILSS